MLPFNLGVLRQYAGAVAASMSVLIIGMWISWPSSAVKYILNGQTSLSVDPEAVSWAVSLLDLANVISPIPSSFISNWVGRKKTLLGLAFALFGSWLLVIFGTNEYCLYLARTIVGLSKGIAFTVVPIYLGEIASTSVRGGVGTLFCAMMNLGIMLELCIGPFFTYNQLNLISSPVPIMFFLCFISFPETPYFLLMKGHVKEAQKSLAWFRNCTEDSSVLEQELKQISSNIEEEMKQEGSFKDLLRSAGVRKAMLIAMGFALLQRLGGISSIITYSTVTLPPDGGYFSPEVYMVYFGVTMIVGPSVCGLLVDRVGRKPLMIMSCVGCALSTLVSAVFYWLYNSGYISDYKWIPYVCVVMYGIMFSIGLGTIPSIVVVELFPSNIRSYASSIAAICYAFGSFVTNKIYLTVKLNFGVEWMFLFFTVSLIICTLLTIMLFFETSGRTFLEIQNILKKENRSNSNDTVNTKV